MHSDLLVPVVALIVGGLAMPAGGIVFVKRRKDEGSLLALAGSIVGACVAYVGADAIRTHPAIGHSSVYLAYAYFVTCLLLLVPVLFLGLRHQE